MDPARRQLSTPRVTMAPPGAAPGGGPAMSDDGSVSRWLGPLRAGDPAAAAELWRRYFHRLAGLARRKLADGPRAAADEEDVALSAFDSFCRAAEAGRLPDLADRDGLWRLLATFTLRKAAHHLRDDGRLRRGGDVGRDDGPCVLANLLAREPEPDLAAELAEECDRLLAALKDPELRRIALLRMDGHTVDEVAAAVGCAPRSAKRKLDLIRKLWAREAGHE